MEACEFTAAQREFQRLGAEVVGVSPDSPERHVRFREKHELKIRLLSDESKETLAAYGAFGTKTMYGRKVEGVIRSTVLIDPEGNVAHHWKSVRAAGHAKQVAAKLAELQKG